MTQWAQSLIRISAYEVETLQKRLAEITTRRVSAEMRAATLEAEAEIERERAQDDPESARFLPAYLAGWKLRRAAAESELSAVAAEEAGARDALASAFEEQKKFEQVAERTRLARLAAAAKVEAGVLDELALRRARG